MTGSHTYSEEGSYTITISVQDAACQRATGTTSATVADAALSMQPLLVGVFGRTVGLSTHFTNADPNGVVNDYQAMISWGDGSSSTFHIIIDRQGNLFLVTGVHTYVKKGTYQITLTIQDGGGSSVTTTKTIIIK